MFSRGRHAGPHTAQRAHHTTLTARIWGSPRRGSSECLANPQRVGGATEGRGGERRGGKGRGGLPGGETEKRPLFMPAERVGGGWTELPPGPLWLAADDSQSRSVRPPRPPRRTHPRTLGLGRWLDAACLACLARPAALGVPRFLRRAVFPLARGGERNADRFAVDLRLNAHCSSPSSLSAIFSQLSFFLFKERHRLPEVVPEMFC